MKPVEITAQVAWRDLIGLSAKELFIENTITLPWLAASLLFAYNEWYIWVIPCAVFFFLTGLRQVHNGFHQALGTNKTLTWLTLYVNSVLMMSSIHAVKFNHLRHHKYGLGEQDYEGHSARLSWWKAILYGPIHIFLIHKVALQLGTKKDRRNVLLEMVSIVLYVIAIVAFDIRFLIYFSVLMLIGEFFSAFFAVWTVHHDCDETTVARTQRKGWKNIITYNMFYHMEHHLFPAVPTIKLPELAKRIDAIMPELEKKSTF